MLYFPRSRSSSIAPRDYHSVSPMSTQHHSNQTPKLSTQDLNPQPIWNGAGSNLQQAILRTFAYYDTFAFPLTADEVWRWLFPAAGVTADGWTREGCDTALGELVAARQLGKKDEFYFLPRREETVAIRRERTARSVKLWARAASTARFIELVPFIRMVAVVNTLAMSNVRPESDIDLLIVTAPQHIWITRLLVSGIVSLLGYRRHGAKVAGRICLSFYLTTDALDLAPLQAEQPDTHLALWASQTVPLLSDGVYEKFQAANPWITKLVPHAWDWDWKAKLLVPNAGLRSIKNFYEIFFSTPIGHWIEAWVRDRQLKRIDRHTESKAKDGTTDVVISEDVLKFHEADRRREYNEAFARRCRDLGLPV